MLSSGSGGIIHIKDVDFEYKDRRTSINKASGLTRVYQGEGMKNIRILSVILLAVLSANLQALEYKTVKTEIKPATKNDILGFWWYKGFMLEFTKDDEYILYDINSYDLDKAKHKLQFKVVKDNVFHLTGLLGRDVYMDTPFLFFFKGNILVTSEMPNPRRQFQGPLINSEKVSQKKLAEYREYVQKRRKQQSELATKGLKEIQPSDIEQVIKFAKKVAIERYSCKEIKNAEVSTKDRAEYSVKIDCEQGKSLPIITCSGKKQLHHGDRLDLYCQVYGPPPTKINLSQDEEKKILNLANKSMKKRFRAWRCPKISSPIIESVIKKEGVDYMAHIKFECLAGAIKGQTNETWCLKYPSKPLTCR